MIKVSVIVPVYNVSEYIERCWDSIRNQTYKNIEVLFVDDCGTDDSVAKLEGYLAVEDTVDARILHHSRNRGLSAARNTGLEAATGEYVYFLDSDDDITEDCIEMLVSPLREKRYDFLVGDYSVVGEGGYSPLSLSTGAIETQKEVLRTYVAGEWYVMAWNKLCRRDFLVGNNLFFKEGLIHEDVLWTFKVACKANNMYVVKQPVYNYYVRSSSIMTSMSIEKDVNIYVEVFGNIAAFVEEEDRMYGRHEYALIMGQPYTTADHTAVTDHGIAAQHGCSCVDDNIIAHIRMALTALHQVAVFVLLEALGAQGHALIQLYMMANVAGLADYHAGTVVDEEIFTNVRAGMDVDTRQLMGVFGHHAGDHWQAQFKQTVGQTEDGNGFKSRVRQHNFLTGTGRRVALVGSLDIGIQHLADIRQAVHELLHQHLCLMLTSITVTTAFIGAVAFVGQHIAGHAIKQHSSFLPLLGHDGMQKPRIRLAFIIHTGIHRRAQMRNQLLHTLFHTISADGIFTYLIILHQPLHIGSCFIFQPFRNHI